MSTQNPPAVFYDEHPQLAYIVGSNDSRFASLNGNGPVHHHQASDGEKYSPSIIHRLPYDIIRDIFLACIDSTRNPTMSRREAPVLLTRISSITRQIALQTPAFWAAIHISILQHDEQSSREERTFAEAIMSVRARGVEEWLIRRPGNMPLRISVDEPYENTSSNWSRTNPLSNEVISILRLCCSRWEDLSLSMSVRSQACLTLMTPEELPILRSVELRRTSYLGYLQSGSWTINGLLCAPGLKRITLCQIVDPRKMHHFMVNWGNITYLSLNNMLTGASVPTSYNIEISVSDALASILNQTTSLISLDIDVFSKGSANLTEIRLPFLKTLQVREHEDPYHLPRLLSYITAPSLKMLLYGSPIGAEQLPPSSLLSVLNRAPGLEELYLCFSRSTYEAPLSYRSILTLCPNLKAPEIGQEVDHPARDELLSGFLLRAGDQCLCPKLEFLQCAYMFHVSRDVLSELITNKIGHGLHLRQWRQVDMQVMVMPHTSIDTEMQGLWPGPDGKVSFPPLENMRLISQRAQEEHPNLPGGWCPWPLGEPFHLYMRNSTISLYKSPLA